MLRNPDRRHRLSAKLRAVVFDFDGTLAELHLDFAEMKRRVGELALSKLGVDRPPPPGMPSLEWVETLATLDEGRAGDGPGLFRSLAMDLIVEMETEAAARGALFPFTRSVLRELNAEGVRVAIVTRNCRQAVLRVFPDVDSYCASFLTREDVTRVKPDPEHILAALRVLDAQAKESLMVGDHPMDIRAGIAARTFTGGVATGNSTLEELKDAGADFIARDCEQLMAILRDELLLNNF